MIYPKHIGIIPDGNRTWASEHGLPKIEGHMKGFNNAIELIKYIFVSTPIEAVTLRGLSTENLRKRPEEELQYLFDIYKMITNELEEFFLEHKINYRRVGSEKGLPRDLVDYFHAQEKKFSFPQSQKISVVAVNYGGRDEIIRGVQKYCEHRERGNKDNIEALTEEVLSSYMDFADLPPVDLVIRTKANEARRLSGFMLRWIGYAELYFTDLKFPAFDTHELQKALQWFDSIAQKRNFGK